jgi:hypothetical protein
MPWFTGIVIPESFRGPGNRAGNQKTEHEKDHEAAEADRPEKRVCHKTPGLPVFGTCLQFFSKHYLFAPFAGVPFTMPTEHPAMLGGIWFSKVNKIGSEKNVKIYRMQTEGTVLHPG